jgi:hypothetical protein
MEFVLKDQGKPGFYMQDLKQTDFTDLIDMLSAQTAVYMTMLRNGATREQFEQCRDEITQIQLEVEQRKMLNNPTHADATVSSITFTQDFTL